MSEFNLVLTRPIFTLDVLEPSSRLPYRWTTRHFPSLVIESCHPNPFNGFGFSTELKIVYGKRENIKYPSKLRISLRSPLPAEECDSIVDWVLSPGKFATYYKPSRYLATLPGDAYGWLQVAVVTKV